MGYYSSSYRIFLLKRKCLVYTRHYVYAFVLLLKVLFRYQWYNIPTTLGTKITTLIIRRLYFISDTTVFRKRRKIQLYRRGQSYTSLIDTFDRNSTSSEGNMLHFPHSDFFVVDEFIWKCFLFCHRREQEKQLLGFGWSEIRIYLFIEMYIPFQSQWSKGPSCW